MKLDSRNPFAAWGFEQEVYTRTTGNDPEVTGMLDQDATNQGYTPIMPADTMFVNDGQGLEMSDEQKAAWSAANGTVEAIFNNEEKMMPTPFVSKREFDGKDLFTQQHDDLYNNSELNYYGIQHADLYTEGDSQSEVVTVIAE